MKLFIIEGPDRVGKNTIINGLTNIHSNVVIRHFSTPKGKTSLDKQRFQMNSFNHEFSIYRNNSSLFEGHESIWIWNRSHIGEYVYSTLYRNLNADWIFDLEKQYGFNYDKNVYLLNLTADTEFLVKNEDGHSFASDIKSKQSELFLFKDAFDTSVIQNKLSLKVDDNGNYVKSDVILNKIKEFLYNE